MFSVSIQTIFRSRRDHWWRGRLRRSSPEQTRSDEPSRLGLRRGRGRRQHDLLCRRCLRCWVVVTDARVCSRPSTADLRSSTRPRLRAPGRFAAAAGDRPDARRVRDRTRLPQASLQSLLDSRRALDRPIIPAHSECQAPGKTTASVDVSMGRRIVTVVPVAGSLSISMCPWCCSMITRAMARPRPAPPGSLARA